MVLAATDTVPSAVTTAVRVVGRVHHDTSNGWANTLVPVSSGFADFDVLMLFVTDNSYGSHTVKINQSDFAARQTQLRVTVIFSH